MYFEDKKPKKSIFCLSKSELRWRVKKVTYFLTQWVLLCRLDSKKFDIVIVSYVSGLPSKSILSLLPVFRALPVARHLQDPDDLVVQLLSCALEQNLDLSFCCQIT